MNLDLRKLGAGVLVLLMVVAVLLVGWRLISDRAPVGRATHKVPGVIRYEPPADERGTAATVRPRSRGPAQVRGRVRDELGEPVACATVALVDGESVLHERRTLTEAARLVSTDANGEFALVWPQGSPASPRVLSVRHARYIAHARSLAGVPEEPLDIVLDEGYELSGNVVLLDNKTPATSVRVVARGIAAAYAAARADRLPCAAAAFQETRTDHEGAFSLQGLPAGLYQIDVVAPGLAVIPEQTMKLGNELAFLGHRALVARTGGEAIRIRVAAIAAVAVRVTNALTGHALPSAHVTLFMPDDFDLLHRSPASMNSEVMLTNGRTYSIHAADLGQGVQARFALSRSYPIPADTRCKIKVIWPGYETRETDSPVVALGTTEEIPIHDIALIPRGKTGSVRFRLRDRKGVPVHHVALLVLQHMDRAPSNSAVPIRFDEQGNGDPVALPIGRYEVRVAASPKWTPVEPVEISVSEGAVHDVTLTLRDFGGFALTVVDERGMPIDDFGVRTALGHQPIQTTASMEGDAHVIRGLPVLVPGLGAAWRGQIVGYPDGPVTIEVTRHGYQQRRILTEARGGEIRPIEVVLEGDPAAPWRGR